MLRRGGADGDLTGYNKLHYDGYDGSEGGDPRILPWMEDLQSATNNIESRLLSLERTHNNVIMKTAESSEMTK